MVQYVYTLGADFISQEIGGKTYTYLYDGHGSVTALSDESGKITDTYSYDAFGNLLKSTGRTENNYRYCGEQFDGTTELYYLRARYMDTSTGRFISQDSYAGSVYDPVSLHKYLYANSNPVMYSDPSGYMGLFAEAIVSVSIDVLFYGISSGMINVGLNLIKELRGANATGSTVNFGYVIGMSFTEGFLTGAFFGACGMLAASLSSAAIYYALGGSSVLFALMSFGAAYAEGKAGNGDLATIYFIFGLGGVVGAKNCFDSAAGSTNTSTSNTQTSNDGNVDFSDYYNADGSPKWPDNYGFTGEPVDTLLKPGTVIDRFGSDGGTYTSPVGTPYEQRALPYTTNTNNYHKYVVTSTIKVKSGNAAPWFNEPGGGVQYKSDIPISDLIEAGYLKEI